MNAIHNESVPDRPTARSNSAGPDSLVDSGDEVRFSSIPLACGGDLPIGYSSHSFNCVYKDECTGEPLPAALVRAAIEEELNISTCMCGTRLNRTLLTTPKTLNWSVCVGSFATKATNKNMMFEHE